MILSITKCEDSKGKLTSAKTEWAKSFSTISRENRNDRLSMNQHEANESMNQNPWRPGINGVTPTDASAVMVAHWRPSSAMHEVREVNMKCYGIKWWKSWNEE